MGRRSRHRSRSESGSPSRRHRRSVSSDSSRESPPHRRRHVEERRKMMDGVAMDRDAERRAERERQRAERQSDARAPAKLSEEEFMALLAKFKTGGVYIPPAKMALLKEHMSQDKNSKEYQKMTWEALKKSLNGLINKVNVANIKNIVPELFGENLIRGRGLFCRAMMKAQSTSPGFTQVYAALVSVVNSKFPNIGEMLLNRVITQFKKGFRRNDKVTCLSSTKFLAHLANQQICHELLPLEILTLLLEKPTDDSVEVAVSFVKECGQLLKEVTPSGLHSIFERFRGILHEGEIDKRVQYMIEGLFAIRKKEFQEFPSVVPELDLVEEEDQITHEPFLEEELDVGAGVDFFKFDPDYAQHEEEYKSVKRDILGDSGDEQDQGYETDESSSEDEEEKKQRQVILDNTEQDMINFRRQVYLTIMSSVDFEECAHKLLKFQLKPGQESELCVMIIECCSQERTFLRFYGLLGQRFCNLDQIYQQFFDDCFAKQYENIHRLETNKLRNVAYFFSHLLYTDAISWSILEYIRLSEENTTAASRIFIKYLLQNLAEHMGLAKLNERFKDPGMQAFFGGLFPRDDPRNTRFAINFFTAIGLGVLTEDLREFLRTRERELASAPVLASSSSDSSSSSSSDSDSSSLSSSDSDSSSSDSDSD